MGQVLESARHASCGATQVDRAVAQAVAQAAQPAAYLAANRAVLHGDIDHVFDPFRAAAYARSERGEVGRGTGAHIDGAAWIGPGAAVGGATIRESIVGADAVVAEGAELSGCVVWDGVYVGLTASRAMRDTMVLALMFFLGFYYFTGRTWGNHGLWLSLTLFLFVRGVVQFIWFRWRGLRLR